MRPAVALAESCRCFVADPFVQEMRLAVRVLPLRTTAFVHVIVTDLPFTVADARVGAAGSAGVVDVIEA